MTSICPQAQSAPDPPRQRTPPRHPRPPEQGRRRGAARLRRAAGRSRARIGSWAALALPAAGLALPAAALALVSPAAARAAAVAPSCALPQAGRSMARANGLLTVSPEPGTRDATPQTQISLLGVPVKRISDVKVIGGRTGAHPGRLMPYSQGDGASFVPDTPFAEGEHVTVNLKLRVGGRTRVVGWRFSVDRNAGLGAAHFSRPPLPELPSKSLQHFRSRPDLRPPVVDVTVHSGTSQPGYIFLSPYSAGQAGPMILNDSGQLVWFDPLRTATKATNLEVQSYRHRPVLTWWQDPLVANGHGRREPEDVIVNGSYEQIAAVHAGNGLVSDVHEFQLTPQGTALIAVKHDIRCDLSSAHGPKDASVWDDVIQEVDVATGLVRWEWNSLDHVALSEAYSSARFASPSYPFDFFHLNSIDPLNRRSLLISARNTWAMYDIDRRTGAIRWRLGGRRSSFDMGPGTRTAWQHDAEELLPSPGPGEMRISAFDDGAVPRVHSQSRAVVELLNLRRRTATLLRAYTNSPALLAGSQGSVQPLSDGQTVVGWGQEPWVTEFDSAGQIVFDAHLPSAEQSYRALRFQWQGTPAAAPRIAVEREGEGLAVYASWNGATGVASWQVLEGPSASAMSVLASAPASGFETRIAAPAAGTLVEVQALNAAGEAIGTSKPSSA